jgi:transcription antitermination factor NusG
VRYKHERLVSSTLRLKGYEEFFPVVLSRRSWSDRTKIVEAPLFPGYVFCRFDPARRVPILESAGVVSIISFGNRLVPVAEEEIAAIQAMLRSSRPEPYPYVNVGQKIRLECGPLAGLEGIVVKVKRGFRLVASVTLLQRSISVEVELDWVAPAARTACPSGQPTGSLQPCQEDFNVHRPQKSNYQPALVGA